METQPSPSTARAGNPGLDVFKIAGAPFLGYIVDVLVSVGISPKDIAGAEGALHMRQPEE